MNGFGFRLFNERLYLVGEKREKEDILGPLDRPVGNETYTIWQFQPRMSPPGRLTIFRGSASHEEIGFTWPR